ncbi:hypothetical protein [uncultured Gordonia sp.]|uniref:hypothetical protein n=1 Tax=uncultured Gordonia sp. TaxID=198437 RepID=UPI00258C74CD|nr:hypothetical protein [uncultured Gordonia sp.]
MPPTAAKSPTIDPRRSAVVDCAAIAVGAVLGVAVGLVLPLPLSIFLRHWLGFPPTDATPGPKALTATYWLPWVLSWLAANIAGVVLVLWPRARLVGLWYLIASVPISTLITLFYFGLDYYGFSPD